VSIARFRRSFRKLLPRFLTEGEGELVAYSLTFMHDMFIERTRLALLARMPTYAPVDALPNIARDRKITRGFNEPEATFRARVIPWLSDHRPRGNPWKLMAQLKAYCGVEMMIRTVDNRGNFYTSAADGTLSRSLDTGNWDWDQEPTLWSRFWVILYPPPELWTEGPVWGPDLWGGAWGNAGYTWGSTATIQQVRSIRNIIRDWKPAGTRCVNIILAFDSSSFNPASTLPDAGFWDLHGDRADPRGRARLATARYWKGTS
jgi:hypothetical protein